MGKISAPQRAKLICGLLASNNELLEDAKKTLVKEFGNIDDQSEGIPFDLTDYYCKEMGESIIRQYISFVMLIPQDTIGAIKVETNLLENIFLKDGKRKINYDPGYVTLDKMVLATTKPATYRIYVGKGIYAQSTLYYKDGSFQPWEWTYPDYKNHDTINFFNGVRKKYKEQLK